MNVEVDLERVRLAHKTVRAELLAERTPDGRWIGQISSSPLATAAAISALVVAHDGDTENALLECASDESQAGELMIQGELSELLVESLHWLARCQNADGGWGDCDLSHSNLAATLLVQAAFRLTGVPAKYADLVARADDFVAAHGQAAGLRRMEGRELLAAPILANCALAGMVPWRQVPTLPYELACLPPYWQRLLRLPIDAQTVPALLAVGRTKFHHDPPRNPLTRLVRRSLAAKGLVLLDRLQASDGSFFDSTPLTAFVVMSLASSGCQKKPIVARGVEFLLASVRPDASWAIYSSQSTRNTALAIRSLAAESFAKQLPIGRSNGESISEVAWSDTARANDLETHIAVDEESSHAIPQLNRSELPDDVAHRLDNAGLNWLLDCQHTRNQPSSLAPPGGWGRSDAPGAISNIGDTAIVLYTLARSRYAPGPARRERIERAARLGIRWLIDAQNEDGGWPTFCPCPEFLANEPSGTDLTAHALLALAAWQRQWRADTPRIVSAREHSHLDEQFAIARDRGSAYLRARQREDGSFLPLWFGNEAQPDETNPVVGTALVLTAYAELELLDSDVARRAANWLLTAQHAGGGWGPPRVPLDYSGTYRPGTRTWRENDALSQCCSVEETSLAIAALLPLANTNVVYAQAVSKGLTWLADAVEQDRHRRPAVLGWCFPRIWYHERLQALLLASATLARAANQFTPNRPAAAPVG
ncbi:MAG: prenyltransferase/squalene oxidase repeat-containing protein [Pirellulales bacterium]